MDKDVLKEIKKLERRERDWLSKEKAGKYAEIKETLFDKVPPTAMGALEKAFGKAFSLLFINGTGIIEKTFDKEELELEFLTSDYNVDENAGRQEIKAVDKSGKMNGFLNNTATTASGFGLGFLGLGIPDVPILIGTILKGVYEIATRYGFDYENDEERIYILRLIKASLAEGQERRMYNDELDGMDYENTTLDEEINKAAKAIAEALLVEKFIQGLPVVGVIGGVVNHVTYRKITNVAQIKYKKRYLLSKFEDYDGGFPTAG